MNYKGKFTPTNPQKYIGDISNITYRSLWERNAMRWCDENPNVVEWGSEEIAIQYPNPVKGGYSKYYPDLLLKMSDGKLRLIEIKPSNQTKPPVQPSKRTRRYLTEVATYAINSEKWKAATAFSQRNNLAFEIWTEETLTQMGISTTATGAQRAQRAERAKPKLIPVRRPRPKRKS